MLHLPTAYESTKTAYPVVYLFYSDWVEGYYAQLVDIHPDSLDGPWQLANLHRIMGDTAAAIRYCEECLRRDPNMTPARDWLKRLKGGDDPAHIADAAIELRRRSRR